LEQIELERTILHKKHPGIFRGSDGIVNENLANRFMNDVKIPEAKCFYGFQIAMENVHCVAGGTRILTKSGYKYISSLKDKVVEVWNGEQFSKSMVMHTCDANGFIVTLSNGMELMCTSEHKWLISIDGHTSRILTKDLLIDMEISEFEYPCPLKHDINDDYLFSNVEVHGYLAGSEPNGTQYNPIDFNCRPRLYVPINYSRRVKLDWLSGLSKCFNDGVITHYDIPFILDVQLLFSTLNIKSVITDDDSIKLMLDSVGVAKLAALGIDIVLASPNITFAPTRIVSIIPFEEKIPMYCFEEPINHTGVFNGILTGQSETYSLLLDTYIKNSDERAHLLNAINTIPCVQRKAEWAMKWISDENASFAKRLVAFAAVEGIFFSGAFCAIFWLKERGVMPGLCSSNEFISRDESLHTEFAIHLYSLLEHTKLAQDEIYELIGEAVDIEDEFINASISCNMLGMNGDLMLQYIKFVADRLIVQLGYDKLYNVTNPFHFMDRISLSNKSNFFEHTRISEYSKARIGVEADDNQFGLDAEF
jgi:ribonucleotide reductase beta subunit family protein with ferritin-like domain